jgi:hypothetical protein
MAAWFAKQDGNFRSAFSVGLLPVFARVKLRER